MMINLYAVRDVVANIFFNPFTCENNMAARRVLSEAVNDLGTPIATNPSDFSLYFIGRYDRETGQIEPMQPEYIIVASALIIPKGAIENDI